ncbi:hypothetical protein B0T16DRAFT_193314 [Cercophora newfieldiana]|uniref:Uncharacterized protein n=1 Tax=Cercophora newfieldiana TaxID=92897 RepID=A0AA40CP29_9PEZI|nr:hypothetical protein B0T16DRAFT_193314 [Cercophora newfieldiana]
MTPMTIALLASASAFNLSSNGSENMAPMAPGHQHQGPMHHFTMAVVIPEAPLQDNAVADRLNGIALDTGSLPMPDFSMTEVPFQAPASEEASRSASTHGDADPVGIASPGTSLATPHRADSVGPTEPGPDAPHADAVGPASPGSDASVQAIHGLGQTKSTALHPISSPPGPDSTSKYHISTSKSLGTNHQYERLGRKDLLTVEFAPCGEKPAMVIHLHDSEQSSSPTPSDALVSTALAEAATLILTASLLLHVTKTFLRCRQGALSQSSGAHGQSSTPADPYQSLRKLQDLCQVSQMSSHLSTSDSERTDGRFISSGMLSVVQDKFCGGLLISERRSWACTMA